MTSMQRHQQIGRIHAAKKQLGFKELDYREFLQGLTGLESCSEMTDRQLNHVLDWMNYLSGRRKQQPLSFSRSGQDVIANHVRLLYAICAIIPQGYSKPPLLSESWQIRMTGRFEQHFERFDQDELHRLVEGIKAIFRRVGQRGLQTLDEKPLEGVNDVRISKVS